MFNMDFLKNKRYMKITASLFLLAVFLCLSLLGAGGEISYDTENSDGDLGGNPASPDHGITEPNDAENSIIFVDVIGCVVNPGVYQLPAGSRVFEAIELAGGLTEEAEVRSINRAALLSDEQVIVVLSVEEYEEQVQAQGGIGFVNGYVDLNLADVKVLESLSGIGPSTAERIVAYRTQHGNFKTIEDLMKVSGIGEKTFEKIKDKICVQ